MPTFANMNTFLLREAIRKQPGHVIQQVPMPQAIITEGLGARNLIGKICQKAGYKSVLLVTDKTIHSLGYHTVIIDSLKKEDISCSVFSDIASEPNIAIIEAGRTAALECKAQCIIALGGGSVMDSCKMIAAAVRLKNRPVGSLLLKFLIVPGKTLPLITIPSTAGTGAEITVGAVITNRRGTKNASVIVGLNITHVVLDSELTLNAPRSVTTSCGIDALSHGIEGYIADVKSDEDDMMKSRENIRLIFENLPHLLEYPDDEISRLSMCRAALYGGNAINKQLAGYVHAFAHSIGAKYHISHGNAIALCLLPIMKFQRNKCLERFAELAVYCGFANETDGIGFAADKFLQALTRLIVTCEFTIKGDFISPNDFNSLVNLIAKDSINYSSPVVLKNKEIKQLLKEISQTDLSHLI